MRLPTKTDKRFGKRTKEQIENIKRGQLGKLKANSGSFKKGQVTWNKKEQEKRTCKCGCGKTFTVRITSPQKFYNKECADKNRIGKKGYWLGKKRPDMSINQKGVNNPMYGNHKFSGSNSANWKGGTSPLDKQIRHCFQYRQWRSDIFTRDEFTCQECGEYTGNGYRVILNAHHINSFINIINKYNIKTIKDAINCEELWNINNGITYCEKCHKHKHGEDK